MKPYVCPSVIVVALFTAGCVSMEMTTEVSSEPVPVEVKPKPTDYVVETIVLDGSKHCRNLLFSNPSRNLDSASHLPDTRLIRFPVVCITPAPGSNAVVSVDNRKIYRYPIEFDAEAKILKWEERGVGQLIRVGLRFDSTGKPIVKLDLEDSKLLRIEELKTPGKEEFERPITRTTQVNAEQVVPLKRWVIFHSGTFIDDESKQFRDQKRLWRVVLVRVLPPSQKP